MRNSLFGVCAMLLLLPSSQEPVPTPELRLNFGAAPVWLRGEQSATLQLVGPAALVGPVACSLFSSSQEEGRATYVALPLEKGGTVPLAEMTLQAPWKLLVLPPKAGDGKTRELRFRGMGLDLRPEPVKMETSCSSCGHQSPAILTATPLGTVYIPFKLDAEDPKAPPPSKVRFQ